MKNEDSAVFIALKLTSICFVSVLLLSVINLITEPQIKKNKEKTEKEAMTFLMPEAKDFSNIKSFKSISDNLKKDFYYYEVYDNNSELIPSYKCPLLTPLN